MFNPNRAVLIRASGRKLAALLLVAAATAVDSATETSPETAGKTDRNNAAAVKPKPSTAPVAQGEKSEQSGIAGNPGAINVNFGTGRLGQLLGMGQDSGVRLGGLWLGDSDLVMSGGKSPGRLTFNSLLIASLEFDLDTLQMVPGAKLGAAFLQFDGERSNTYAGTLTGYNGVTQQTPLDRSELYELWWRQSLLDDKLIMRIGKSVPTYDFNNVVRALPIQGEIPYIAAVSALIYTPIFVNPSILGVMPGYYNSAWGITTTALPMEDSWVSYGIYDGSLARGRQTGTHAGPTFDSYYFNIGEIGHHWSGELPGKIAVGGWGQSGMLSKTVLQANGSSKYVSESGAQGFYAVGAQTLWHRRQGSEGNSVIGFMQYGINNSTTMLVNQFLGGGLTGFGLIPGRPKDTLGAGIAVSWLNFPSKSQDNEIITQFYYQAHLIGDLFLQPTFSYVPNPAGWPTGAPSVDYQAYPAATALSVQLVALF